MLQIIMTFRPCNHQVSFFCDDEILLRSIKEKPELLEKESKDCVVCHKVNDGPISIGYKRTSVGIAQIDKEIKPTIFVEEIIIK